MPVALKVMAFLKACRRLTTAYCAITHLSIVMRIILVITGLLKPFEHSPLAGFSHCACSVQPTSCHACVSVPQAPDLSMIQTKL